MLLGCLTIKWSTVSSIIAVSCHYAIHCSVVCLYGQAVCSVRHQSVCVMSLQPHVQEIDISLLGAAAVTALLEHYSSVLEDASEVLYEILFTLAQDDWPQVSNHCQAWLAGWLPQHHKGKPRVRRRASLQRICCMHSRNCPHLEFSLWSSSPM